MNSLVKETVYYKPETADCLSAVVKMPVVQEETKALYSTQSDAYKLFADYGIPYPKLERWKYTNIYPVLKKISYAPAVLAETWEGDLLFVRPLSESLDEDWVVSALTSDAPSSDGAKDDQALWHLNAVNNHQGWVIDIPDGVEVEEQLLLKSINKDSTYNSLRLLIRLGKNARLVLRELHDSEHDETGYFKNWVTQIICEDNSELVHIRKQNESKESVYVQNVHAKLSRSARYYALTVNKGAKVFRGQYHIDLNGEGAHTSIRASADVGDEQHIDITSIVKHNVKSCTSDQVVRNVLSDKSTGVFQGKAYVAKGADFTDGSQSSKALLLSPFASMHAKPELEIYADEVKCAHGATCGAINEEALFYARSRGIPEVDAKRMLVAAFLEEVKDGFPIDEDQ